MLRRRTIGRSLVALGVVAVGFNALLLARDGGSATPQWVNIALGIVVAAFGARTLRGLGR
jgi:hypothetical protein